MNIPVRMNRLVKLQALELGRDEYGAPSTVWQDFAEVWASIDDLSGREYVNAGGTQNAVTTKIMIRHRDGVMPTMRVLHGVVPYSVEAVLGQDNRTLLLMCSRGANLG